MTPMYTELSIKCSHINLSWSAKQFLATLETVLRIRVCPRAMKELPMITKTKLSKSSTKQRIQAPRIVIMVAYLKIFDVVTLEQVIQLLINIPGPIIIGKIRLLRMTRLGVSSSK